MGDCDSELTIIFHCTLIPTSTYDLVSPPDHGAFDDIKGGRVILKSPLWGTYFDESFDPHDYSDLVGIFSCLKTAYQERG
jgi:hypothetical protein